MDDAIRLFLANWPGLFALCSLMVILVQRRQRSQRRRALDARYLAVREHFQAAEQRHQESNHADR